MATVMVRIHLGPTNSFIEDQSEVLYAIVAAHRLDGQLDILGQLTMLELDATRSFLIVYACDGRVVLSSELASHLARATLAAMHDDLDLLVLRTFLNIHDIVLERELTWEIIVDDGYGGCLVGPHLPFAIIQLFFQVHVEVLVIFVGSVIDDRDCYDQLLDTGLEFEMAFLMVEIRSCLRRASPCRVAHDDFLQQVPSADNGNFDLSRALKHGIGGALEVDYGKLWHLVRLILGHYFGAALRACL
mmetsp:Transcript_38156/g.81109  ORF Transcript_38156/g.81109 Transcript_38156/m.81109 type:complete len:245 (+) Transcript_38156:436-1170(+)